MKKRLFLFLCQLCCFAGVVLPIKAQPPANIISQRVQYTNRCLQIDGKDVFIYSGAFHYFRCPKALWAARFEKIKAAGFNAVETYVPWNWHERTMPASPDDFSHIDLTELTDWMTMAERYGLYLIIRPGPYICAEWAGGGFPQWLVAEKKQSDSAVWLQTMDTGFLRWNRHWYQAVCKAVAPHQLTRAPGGKTGVILFQIENEYERIHFIPKAEKKEYLETLATYAREGEIEVPLFTCWTRESRQVAEGPLKGIVDFVNYYPLWNIKKFLNATRLQWKEQPNKPLMSAELQGGWYSAIGGKASKEVDGIAPVQTQNLTLFALQLGYSLINYYMLVGGTNFDDWASREATTTYDCDAAIHENGGVGERYRRMWGIGHFLQQHGTKLLRSDTVAISRYIADTAVECSVRRAADGSMYVFVRTEDRWHSHNGSLRWKTEDGTEYTVAYKLEPFGSRILYLPAGNTHSGEGTWFPVIPEPQLQPASVPPAIVFTRLQTMPDSLPVNPIVLLPGERPDDKGIYDKHFLYYEAEVPAGAKFTVSRTGQGVFSGCGADGVLVKAGETVLQPVHADDSTLSFIMPAQTGKVVLLYENRGLHHHTKAILEANWLNGTRGVQVGSNYLPLQLAATEKERGLRYSATSAGKNWQTVALNVPAGQNQLLTWYKATFTLPAPPKGVGYPWQLHLKAKGNGFIYLNGHCLGRYWEEGPQQDFFLPACWLNTGKGAKNIVAFNLRPVSNGVQVQEVGVMPCREMAELTN